MHSLLRGESMCAKPKHVFPALISYGNISIPGTAKIFVFAQCKILFPLLPTCVLDRRQLNGLQSDSRLGHKRFDAKAARDSPRHLGLSFITSITPMSSLRVIFIGTDNGASERDLFCLQRSNLCWRPNHSLDWGNLGHYD